MELINKQGFKQTDAGLIPVDWEICTINKDITVARGGSPRPIQNYLSTFSSGINWIKIGDTSSKSKYIVDAKEKIIPEGEQFSRSVKAGDFLLSNSMSFGRPYILKINGCIHDGWLVLQNYQDSYDTEYLYYILMSKYVFDQYLMKASGSSVLNLNKELVKTVTLFKPPLTEQKAIATALSDVDDLIANLDKLITKKKAIKQGAMQQLLTPPHKGGKRLVGYNGEWMEKKLGEFCDITGAGIDKKIIEGEKPVRLFNYMDVMKRDYVFNHELNHQVTAPYSKTNSCNVLEGDIFLTPSSELRTDIGVSAIAMEDMEGVVYSYHVYRLRYNIEINKFYGLYLLKTKQFLDQAEMMCEGSGKRYVVSMGKFRNMTVYLPKDITEQEAISDILYDMDAEIEQLESKKAKYLNIKQGMMQELLTGKTRLV